MSTSVETPSLAGVTVAAAMSPGLITCPPSAGLRTVAAMMAVYEVHAVLVTTGPPAMIGDLDLVAQAGSIDAPAATAARPPATIRPEDTLAAAAQALVRDGRSHLVVVAPDDGHPVGMLSTLDVAAALASRSQRAMRTIRPRMARPQISTSRLERVSVGTAMHPGVFVCSPTADLTEVAAILVDRRVHCVAVAGTSDPGSWKFVTDLSVVRAATSGAGAKAADLGGDATWISRDAMLDEAAGLMVGKGTSHLLVTGDREPAGVLSTLDVIGVLAVQA